MKAPISDVKKLVPFQIAAFAAFEALLPWRTVFRYLTKFV